MASVIYTICFILFEIIIFKVARSEFELKGNEINYASQWKPGRTKRSLYDNIPKELKIRIDHATGGHINLRLITTNQYLANQYLPVLTSSSDINVNVMKDVDEFVMYYDDARCSAFVYFKKSKALYGVVGMDYYIQNLRLEFNDEGQYQLETVAEPYIQRREHLSAHIHPEDVFPPPSDTDAWEDYLLQPNYDSNQNHKRKINSDAGPSNKYQRSNLDGRIRGGTTDTNEHSMNRFRIRNEKVDDKQFYLETLVFVTRDIADLFKKQFGGDNYIEWIVRYYIIYFNAVDMTFKKFPSRPNALQINIAKIVIEDDMQPFGFMSNDELQFTDIIGKLPQYLHAHNSEYTPDSFDNVFIHTSRIIMDDIVPIKGLSKHGNDLYGARKNNQFYDVVPITVVRYQNVFADYVVAAHEIGRILNIKIDSRVNGLTRIGQCHSIMQREGPKCINCLKWSDDSDKQFNEFLRGNRNRCFLLNEPRSLLPPGPSRFLTPHRQCLCFGYDSYTMCADRRPARRIGAVGCAGLLQCQNSEGMQLHVESTVRPFDGTPCTNGKVCWNGNCVPLHPFTPV